MSNHQLWVLVHAHRARGVRIVQESKPVNSSAYIDSVCGVYAYLGLGCGYESQQYVFTPI